MPTTTTCLKYELVELVLACLNINLFFDSKLMFEIAGVAQTAYEHSVVTVLINVNRCSRVVSKARC